MFQTTNRWNICFDHFFALYEPQSKAKIFMMNTEKIVPYQLAASSDKTSGRSQKSKESGHKILWVKTRCTMVHVPTTIIFL